MKGRPVGWARALRAVAGATLLVIAVIFVAGNFVLVDTRVLWLGFQTRLAWVAVVPAALGFLAGRLWSPRDGRRTLAGRPPPGREEL